MTSALLAVIVGCAAEVTHTAAPPDSGAPDAATPDAATLDAVAADAATADAVVDVASEVDVRDDTASEVADAAPDTGCSSPTEAVCGGACVDLENSRDHCGRCGHACCVTEYCVRGTCRGSCGSSLQLCRVPGSPCASTCVDLFFDSNHCGGCNNVCAAGTFCYDNRCIDCAACGPESMCCGNRCTHVRSDPRHCGGCGRPCPAGERCLAGMCSGALAALAPCGAAADYVEGATVRFGGALGSAYAPRCLTVRAGGTVTWEGSFDDHPLAPSTRGAPASPIPRTASGGSFAVRFPTTGFYPYYCTRHGGDMGEGMAGVVRVIE